MLDNKRLRRLHSFHRVNSVAISPPH